MTQQEFLSPYSELATHFGTQSFSTKRGALLFEVVKDLPAHWWKQTAHAMIRKNDGRHDIEAAAKLEISNNRAHERVNDATAWNNLTKEMAGRGLEQQLKIMGAKSLWEAIENKKNKPA